MTRSKFSLCALERRSLLALVGLSGLSAGLTASAAETLQRLPTTGQPIPVAFLIDDYATVIDFCGPWEAFQDAGVAGGPGFLTYTVAPSTQPILTTGSGGTSEADRKGLRITPDYGFAEAPQPKVIVIGAQSGHTPQKIAWIRKAAAEADVVLSVCTGAFLLAKTGLLDGLSATTHHDFYDSFEKQFGERIKLVRARRFVDNGKYVSGGGLTSGVDASLHVIARYYGMDAAEKSALYMEHYSDDWKTGVARRA